MKASKRRNVALFGILLLVALAGCGSAPAPATGPQTADLKYDAETRKVLMRRLQSENPGERIMAATILAIHGPEAQDALPALAEAEKDRDPNVRAAATKAIAAIKGAKATK